MNFRMLGAQVLSSVGSWLQQTTALRCYNLLEYAFLYPLPSCCRVTYCKPEIQSITVVLDDSSDLLWYMKSCQCILNEFMWH